MTRNRELGEFLQASRARITPSDAGLSESPHLAASSAARRVAGLRREEVARLAGVSADYYAKLEQGRTKQPSVSVLTAIAEALRLNDTERDYLLALVQPHPRAPTSSTNAPQRVRPGARRLLQSLPGSPSFIMGRGTAILAMNDLAKALFFNLDDRPASHRNLAVWTFLDPEARHRYVDWQRVAADNAAILRMDAASSPDDPEIAAIVGMLSVKSEEFRHVWSEHHVFECTYGRKTLDHPAVGRLDLDYETLDIPGSPGQTLHVYSAAIGSPSDEALRHLGAWASAGATIETLERSRIREDAEGGRPLAHRRQVNGDDIPPVGGAVATPF